MSKRYEEKERSGELHSEFKRIEDKSKEKVEQQQQPKQDEEGAKSSRGRRRNREAGEEEDGEEAVENGEVCYGFNEIYSKNG